MMWKDIKGYEGIYQVSDDGRVKSLNRIDSAGRHLRGRYLKILLKDGYHRVTLQCNGKIKHAYIHRLVAECFLENNDENRIVRHINGDTTDNNVSNLKWAEYYEVVHKQKVFYGRKPVNMYNKQGVLLKKFKSITEASKYIKSENPNIAHPNTAISSACKNNIKTAYKYIWRFANKEKENE